MFVLFFKDYRGLFTFELQFLFSFKALNSVYIKNQLAPLLLDPINVARQGMIMVIRNWGKGTVY